MGIYVVLVASLIVWFALFGYMARLDGRIRDLENRE